jgi:Chondroitinase B
MPTLCIALVLLLVPVFAAAQLPCSHYAAPNGSGSTCSKDSPCNVGTWLSSKAAPGGVLCLRDGVYKGDSQMLAFSSKSGTAGSPITVRAENDGKVLIDGEFQRRPIDCNASYITVMGLNAKDGNDTTMVVRGHACTMQRIVAWSGQPADGGIENVIDVGGTNNLVEDCGSFGYARKTLAAGARGGSGPNTIRRCWVEHNGSPYGSAEGNPTDPVDLGYNQDQVTMENIIGRRNILSSATEPEAPLHAYSTRNSALLGSIVYATNADNIETSMMLNITAESGSHAGSGHVTTNFLLQDTVLLAAPVHEHLKAMSIEGGKGSSGNVAKNVVGVAPQGLGSCTSDGWECSNLHGGRTLAEATKGKTIYELAPGTCFRYKDRQLTSEPLWPWPMQARIQAALESARMPTRNVTKHIEQTFGAIPAQCGGTTPVPPQPSPDIPVAPTQVQAVLQGASVVVSWTDTVNTIQTGYVIERKVGSGEYTELTQTNATARSTPDTAPGPGAQNCYQVYARGPAGPSGLSSAACVDVPGTPIPPIPPSASHVPLACQGTLGESGRMSMICRPQAERR